MSHLVLIISSHWFFHPLGTCPAGQAGLGCKGYNFWSGIAGSFLISLPNWFIAGFLFFRHTNCHAPWCPNVGKYPLEGTPFKLCKKHHPDIPDNLTLEHIMYEHRRAKKAREYALRSVGDS